MKILLLILFLITVHTEPLKKENEALPQTVTVASTRRILRGDEAKHTRPYMVYLRPAKKSPPFQNWLCGGVIIHERYIMTSAACIEDVRQFYVVSGTHRWVPPTEKNDECIKRGAKKAIWKCVSKTYNFDGKDFDNIRWMVKDIAVVKVEDDFNFKRKVKGCDFIPQKVAFNNYSECWRNLPPSHPLLVGGPLRAMDIVRETINSPVLLETDVVLISKKICKARWNPRYHHIIDENMICAKDSMDADAMSALCKEQGMYCKELVYSDEEDKTEEEQTRRFVMDPKEFQVHSTDHKNWTRRTKTTSGGFCENDHGGPLIVGRGNSAKVVGIISACLTMDRSLKCYGPFLYTSVWKNRYLINCAIEKERGGTCRRLSSSANTEIFETTFDWSDNLNK